MDIIDGSTSWIYGVPEEYSIKCVEQYTVGDAQDGRILKFSFVMPKCQKVGTGFVQKYGIIRVPVNADGIVISIDHISSMPEVYFKNCFGIFYAGSLKYVPVGPVHKPPEFFRVYYYSKSIVEKQKSDEIVPDFLKAIAEEHASNVAYFEF